MRHVEITGFVPNTDPRPLFDCLSDFSRYPELTDAIREVTVVDSGDGHVESSWKANFRNGVLQWREQDYLDPDSLTITFVQTEGDFAEFHGNWAVEQIGPDALVRFTAAFDLGMPSLAPMIDPIAMATLTANIGSILQGLGAQLLSAAASPQRGAA